ncbi:MAG: HAD family hydrolase [Gloeomargarita sp. SKYG116]|nr:HAD family hydrolase [Gloeomargarita sp. SKYG116]MDW8402133.1 HAD family hydrolase [Gloeomargarita sp. SKYGB_i_bin116]
MPTLVFNGLPLPTIQAVVWDKDGTLADTLDYWRQVGEQRLQCLEAKAPGVAHRLRRAFGFKNGALEPGGLLATGSRYENEIAAAAYVAELGWDWQSALHLVRDIFQQVEREGPSVQTIPLRHGAREVLQQLAQAGYRQAILSADISPNVQAFVAHNQLHDLLDYYTGIDLPPSKPDPQALLHTCQILGVDPSQTVMVGDSPVDMEMAKRAGCAAAIAVSWGFHQGHKLAPLADSVISDWSQIQVLG